MRSPDKDAGDQLQLAKIEDSGQSMVSTDDGGGATGSQAGRALSQDRSSGGGSAREDPSPRALLKASPPMPMSSIIGRYRIRIWRATRRQPFGINFVVIGDSITIGEDLEHLGMRQADTLVSVNGIKAVQVDQCRRVLAEASSVDMVLQHRELDEGPAPEAVESCAFGIFSLFRSAPARKEAVIQPTDPACFASTRDIPPKQLRVMLSTTPLTVVPAGMCVEAVEDGSVEFELTLQRASLKQRFGMNFSMEPVLPSMEVRKAQRIIVSEDCYVVGVNQGDLVLAVNGVPYERASDCQRMLERSMTVTLRLKRKSTNGYPEISLPPDIEHLDEVEEVLLPSSRACGSGLYCA